MQNPPRRWLSLTQAHGALGIATIAYGALNSNTPQKRTIVSVKITAMKTADFDYNLPEELIAQEPAAVRDECRLLVLDAQTGALSDKIFHEIEGLLNPGDLLVANETRVMPARLLGQKRTSGGAAEVFLLREVAWGASWHSCVDSCRELGKNSCAGTSRHSCADSCASALMQNQCAYWEVLVKPGKRLKPGTGAKVDFLDAEGNVALTAEIVDWAQGIQGTQSVQGAQGGQDGKDGYAQTQPQDKQRGLRIARLETSLPSLDEALHAVGSTPLPPYIKNYVGDKELYQTVYSKRESSAAAPTAGLHFTPELIDCLRNAGVGWETVELEVGLDTFRVVDEENAEDHQMHTEFYTVPPQTVEAIKRTKRAGGRVIAVGTTSVRSLESAWHAGNGHLKPQQRATTSLYLLPGSQFHVVDAIITNFHVPRSTLMMLVSAFAGREKIMNAYKHAIDERYHFLSFGDAMFIH